MLQQVSTCAQHLWQQAGGGRSPSALWSAIAVLVAVFAKCAVSLGSFPHQSHLLSPSFFLWLRFASAATNISFLVLVSTVKYLCAERGLVSRSCCVEVSVCLLVCICQQRLQFACASNVILLFNSSALLLRNTR